MHGIHLAEDVLRGHPDRLADAIADAIVDVAVRADPDALVGVEVAVHRDGIIITGRIAATGIRHDLIDAAATGAVTRAGYTGRWHYTPSIDTRLLCLDALSEAERGIRRYSDDQSITLGYACDSPATDWRPPGAWAAARLRDGLWALRCAHDDRLGPDGKVLVRFHEHAGRFVWDRCIASIQHDKDLGYDELHALVLPALADAADKLGTALPGLAETWHPDLVRLNGAGDFTCGGTFGDNGLSGKKLVVDFYGPTVPIGGGAITGKDPHKVDRRGAARARELALDLVRTGGAREALVYLVWAPGLHDPEWSAALVDGAWQQLPADPRTRGGRSGVAGLP